MYLILSIAVVLVDCVNKMVLIEQGPYVVPISIICEGHGRPVHPLELRTDGLVKEKEDEDWIFRGRTVREDVRGRRGRKSGRRRRR